MRINFPFLGLSSKVIWLALTPSIEGFPSWVYSKKYEKDDSVKVNSQAISESNENHVLIQSRNTKNKGMTASDEFPMNYGLPQFSFSEAPIFTAIQPYIPISTELPPLLTIQTFPNSEESPATPSNYRLQPSQISAVLFKSSYFSETGNLSLPLLATSISEKNSQIPAPTFFPGLISPCDEDNCLRNFIRSSTVFSDFCSSYTASNIPKITGIPSRISLCNGDSSRISSACSCFMTGFSSSSQGYSLISSTQISLSATPISSSFDSAIFIPGSQFPSSAELPLSQATPTLSPLYSGKVSGGGSLEFSTNFGPSISINCTSVNFIASSNIGLVTNSINFASTIGESFGPTIQPSLTGSYPISNSTLLSKAPSTSGIGSFSGPISGSFFDRYGETPTQTTPLNFYSSIASKLSLVNTGATALPESQKQSLSPSMLGKASLSDSQQASVSILPFTMETSISFPMIDINLVLSIYETIISTITVNDVTASPSSLAESSKESAVSTEFILILTATVSLTGLIPSILPLLEAPFHLSNQLSAIESIFTNIPPINSGISVINSLGARLSNIPSPSISYTTTVQTIYIAPTKTVYLSDVSKRINTLPTYTCESIEVTSCYSISSRLSNTIKNSPLDIRTLIESIIISSGSQLAPDQLISNTDQIISITRTSAETPILNIPTKSFASVTSLPSFSRTDFNSNLDDIESTIFNPISNDILSQITAGNFLPTPDFNGYY
ncbi:hypothetical protein OnM2_027024 [Erysiphe neolycopersici]|uniref:Uncharacterized protein n=1 Tax=Erysiphe neolycopersici TaxID=212602 RepID=A0A420I0J9_9PEZI|nr:hypothetical protein OnM2_027024 [Erysiphe neolycopersici]